ncbi:hypothetical protein SteCoe_27991 [Stentor coeruleus]|uniref:C2H2-type domain-containing protein n=1 Tax=Stentor coeruleus TaxID=5963 RepID=A0A1R2B967_9CILI|nr:hypothetical protein SteCoe_27991 [Stentor coeruleus]
MKQPMLLPDQNPQSKVIIISCEQCFSYCDANPEVITKTKIFACLKCVKNFATQNALKKHQKKHILMRLNEIVESKKRKRILNKFI